MPTRRWARMPQAKGGTIWASKRMMTVMDYNVSNQKERFLKMKPTSKWIEADGKALLESGRMTGGMRVRKQTFCHRPWVTDSNEDKYSNHGVQSCWVSGYLLSQRLFPETISQLQRETEASFMVEKCSGAGGGHCLQRLVKKLASTLRTLSDFMCLLVHCSENTVSLMHHSCQNCDIHIRSCRNNPTIANGRMVSQQWVFNSSDVSVPCKKKKGWEI